MQQNNNIKINTLKMTKNRFKRTKHTVNIRYTGYKFVFTSSINSDLLYFTNYLTSKICKEGKFFINIISEFNNDFNKAIWDFDCYELIDDNKKTKRLIDILKLSYPQTNLSNLDIISNVIKLNYSKLPAIHLYIYNNSGILEIYLIDLYHLAISAPHPVTHRDDPKGIYNSKRNAKLNIMDVINEIVP